MVAPAPRPATYEDLLALPDHLVGEIVDGELHASPRPAPRHSLAASALGLDGDAYRVVLTAAGDQVIRAEPFDAIELELALLWAR